jgi:hypothetical protein
MNREMIAVAVVASGIVLGLAAAPIASAEGASDFVNYLAANDPDFKREAGYEAIDVGYSICGLLESEQNFEEDADMPGTPVSRTLDFMTAADGMRRSFDNARIWLIGSVSHLCPELTS